MPETGHTDLEALPSVQEFSPITLQEMDSVKLMNRVDTKYVTSEDTLALVLQDAAAAGYMILVTEGGRTACYDSIYFDTPGLRMYLDHHNRRLVRQKVRTRLYVASDEAFLEIKRKNNHGRTRKKRMGIPVAEMTSFGSDALACGFLSDYSWFTADALSPSLETVFRRITLVNPARTERLTIDTAVEFSNFRTGRKASLGKGVIIELKQDGRVPSPMKEILLGRRVKPLRVSKYCVGVALTDPAVKSGRFKPKIKMIEKQINNDPV